MKDCYDVEIKNGDILIEIDSNQEFIAEVDAIGRTWANPIYGDTVEYIGFGGYYIHKESKSAK